MAGNGRKGALFCGMLRNISTRSKVFTWAFLALIAATLAFSQFGIMSYGDSSAGDVNFVFILAPVALGGLLLGFVPGALLGLVAGLLLMFRSLWTPTSYFDMFLTEYTLSVVPIFAGAVISSAVFVLAESRWPVKATAEGERVIHLIPLEKAVLIAVGCALLATVFSAGARGVLDIMLGIKILDEQYISYLSSNLGSVNFIIEAAINTIILFIVCMIAQVLVAKGLGSGKSMSLGVTFQSRLLAGMLMMFMLASATSFCIETVRADAQTEKDLGELLDYLEVQVNDHNERTNDLKRLEFQAFVEKAHAAAELVAADPTTISDNNRLYALAEMLGLESLTVADGQGVIVADSEFADEAVGFNFASTEATSRYMSLIDGQEYIVEEPRVSIDPDGTASDKVRVFCGVPRVDAPGFVQISGNAEEYQQLLSAASIEHLADDYVATNKGTVAVIRDGKIITCNDEKQKTDGVLNYILTNYENVKKYIEENTFTIIYDESLNCYVVFEARTVQDCLLLALMPLPETYATRTTALISNAVLFLFLLVVMFFIAWRLLRHVVVEPIHRTNDILSSITAGNLGNVVDERGVSEFAALSTGINTTVGALKEAISEAERRNAQELVAAKAIQESSLPRDFPAFPDIDRFDIYASMKTAKEVGGDFYDFFLIEEGKLGFVIADVSGKGIPAALFMMTAKTQVRTYMEEGLPIDEAINAANHQLCIGNDAGMFVTMFACVLDYESGVLSYINAGHNPPLILIDGTWEWMRDVSGMPLGLFDGLPYTMYSRQLKPCEVLYMYTDGVTEAMNADGQLFTEKRLEECLYLYGSMNPRSIGVGVRRAITDFTLDCEQSDDITMLVLKYGVPPERKAVMVLPASDKQLVHVCNFIHEELRRRNAPKSVYNPLDIAAEELFVNVCHYAYPDATPENPGEVRIGFEYDATPPSLTVQISDDGIAYNPLEKPDAVTPDNIADVPIGGLGILMAKNSVDEMVYERDGESNVLTFKKSW